jgi:hypothetical protein
VEKNTPCSSDSVEIVLNWLKKPPVAGGKLALK